jgi:hypothetical protein
MPECSGYDRELDPALDEQRCVSVPEVMESLSRQVRPLESGLEFVDDVDSVKRSPVDLGHCGALGTAGPLLPAVPTLGRETGTCVPQKPANRPSLGGWLLRPRKR